MSVSGVIMSDPPVACQCARYQGRRPCLVNAGGRRCWAFHQSMSFMYGVGNTSPASCDGYGPRQRIIWPANLQTSPRRHETVPLAAEGCSWEWSFDVAHQSFTQMFNMKWHIHKQKLQIKLLCLSSECKAILSGLKKAWYLRSVLWIILRISLHSSEIIGIVVLAAIIMHSPTP